jgi:hypothetical protein
MSPKGRISSMFLFCRKLLQNGYYPFGIISFSFDEEGALSSK